MCASGVMADHSLLGDFVCITVVSVDLVTCTALSITIEGGHPTDVVIGYPDLVYFVTVVDVV